MIFTYSFEDEAQQQYEDAIWWYAQQSIVAAKSFINRIEDLLEVICKNPYVGKNLSKNFREFKVKNYPYSLIYTIEEGHIIVWVVFHHSMNPDNKYPE